jgi:hypothetical protein
MSDNKPVIDKGDPTVNPQTPAWFLKYSWFAKAIMAGISTFLLAFLTALLPYMTNGWHISLAGWTVALIAGLASGGLGGGAVFVTPNTVKVNNDSNSAN